MSKYNPEKHREWYLKNRERLLVVRRQNNKKRSQSEEGREKDRIRNASPERKAYRKSYKKTEKGKEADKRYIAKPKTKEMLRSNRIKYLYGITESQYWILVADQHGVCAICGMPDKGKLHIDHDHTSGKVRGLLCGKCNRGLGMFGDDIDRLETAKIYLSKHEI